MCQLLSNSDMVKSMTYFGNPCGLHICKISDLKFVIMKPPSNSKCDQDGRCFQGRCVQPGSLLVNVASGKCLTGNNPFYSVDLVQMVSCQRSSTAFDRFNLMETSEPTVKRLKMPVQLNPASGHSNVLLNKCLVYSSGGFPFLIYRDCNGTKLEHAGWILVDVGNDEFLLSHASTKYCAKENSGSVRMYSNCDKSDSGFRWKFAPVYPTAEMFPPGHPCKTDLQAIATVNKTLQSRSS